MTVTIEKPGKNKKTGAEPETPSPDLDSPSELSELPSSEQPAVGPAFAATLPKEKLLPMLTAAARCVSEKSPLPILRNALLEFENGALTVAATNNTTALRQAVGAVGELGKVASPARDLATFVNALPAGDVSLFHQGGELLVRSGKAEFRLPTLPDSDFPAIPEMPEQAVRISLPGSVLLRLINESSYAFREDDSGSVMCSVALRLEAGKLVVWSTDSSRLALAQAETSETLEEAIEILLPPESLREVGRLITDNSVISLGLHPNQTEFRLPGSVFWTRNNVGKGAPFERVANIEGQKAVFPRALFLESLRRLSLVRATGGKTTFEFGLQIVARSVSEDGRIEEEIEAVSSSIRTTFAVSARYLIDALSPWNDEKFELTVSDNWRPMLLAPIGRADAIAVVMPMSMEGTG